MKCLVYFLIVLILIEIIWQNRLIIINFKNDSKFNLSFCLVHRVFYFIFLFDSSIVFAVVSAVIFVECITFVLRLYQHFESRYRVFFGRHQQLGPPYCKSSNYVIISIPYHVLVYTGTNRPSFQGMYK